MPAQYGLRPIAPYRNTRMDTHSTDPGFLSFALVLLGACVVSVPIARRLKLSPIVAYLAAGVVIGPWGIGVVRAPSTILAVADLGIVLMMFVIGLELELSRLIAMRRDILCLGRGALVPTPATSCVLGAGAIAAVTLAGRYLLNPFFRLLSETGAREVMTAAALLVVLGAALLMLLVGMSMALGAFLAGVLLAESNYRHELEADIEPFRGLLLALFFLGVGMTIDLDVVRSHPWLILAAALAITAIKAAIVWGLFGMTCVRRGDALRAGSILTGAGEFAFVLFPLGASLGVLSAEQRSVLTAIAAVTMLFGPPVAALADVALRRFARGEKPEPEEFDGVTGSVLVIGFGRFGQIVSQCLLAEGVDVTAIDVSAGMIQNASRFGFK